MARTYAKLKGSIWQDDDWRALPASHQRVYLLLFSQPEISNCGVLPYLPGRWARMAADTTVDDIVPIVADLQAARFVVADTDASELLIRTYVKHDQVAEQPKIRAAAIRQYELVHSQRIRTVLAEEYPDVFALAENEKPYPEPYAVPYREGLERLEQAESEGYGKGYAVPPRARAQAATGHQPPSNRTGQPPTAPAPETSANGAAADAETPDQNLQAHLEQLGWKPWQIRRATADPARAQAIADTAAELHATGDVDNPGGWAWREFESGRAPAGPPQSTLAPGALAATRSTPAPKLPHECTHDLGDGITCGSTFATPERLAQHIADCHTDHERTPLPPEVQELLSRATPASTEPPPPPRPAPPTPPEP